MSAQQQDFPFASAPKTDDDEAMRQIALRLHSLNEDDQAWFLQRLPQAVRERVLPMLQEVSVIGFPKDRTWLRDVPRHGEGLRVMYDATLPEYVNRINQASLDRIAELLDHECDGIAATVLAYYRWNWLEGYIKQIKSARRRRITGIAREIKKQRHFPLIDATVRALASQLPASHSTQNIGTVFSDADLTLELEHE